MNALSLFSGMGIGESYLKKIGINVVLANNLYAKKSDVYKYFYSKVDMIDGDIRDSEVKKKIIEKAKEKNIKLLITKLPLLSYSRNEKGNRMYEYFDVINDIINSLDLDYILILGKIIPYNKYIREVFNEKHKYKYNIHKEKINYKDFGIAKNGYIVLTKLYKKGLVWNDIKLDDNIVTIKDIRESYEVTIKDIRESDEEYKIKYQNLLEINYQLHNRYHKDNTYYKELIKFTLRDLLKLSYIDGDLDIPYNLIEDEKLIQYFGKHIRYEICPTILESILKGIDIKDEKESIDIVDNINIQEGKFLKVLEKTLK